MRLLRILMVAGIVGTLGCASVAPSPAGTDRDRFSITSEELRASTAANLYEAIERLRPQVLSRRHEKRAGPAATFPRVYLDGQPYGGISSLRSIQVASVQEVAYLRPPEASNRYGAGHTAAAIYVTTRR